MMNKKVVAVKNLVLENRCFMELKSKILNGTVKAVLFDCDGVITDTEPIHYKSWQMAFNDAEVFKDHEPVMVQGLPAEVGALNVLKWAGKVPQYVRLEVLYADNVSEEFSEIKELIEKTVEAKDHYYLELIEKEPLAAIEGVKELIKVFVKHGLKLAMVSSSNSSITVLRKLELDKYFTKHANITGLDVGAYSSYLGRNLKGKPFPDVFLEAAARLGVKPESVIGIEDTAGGVAAINNAGMLSLGYDPEKRSTLTDAGIMVKSFSELLNYLD